MRSDELTMKDIKAELLSLYIDSDQHFVNLKDYYTLFQKSIFKFFGISDSCFFVYQDETFKTINLNEDMDFIKEDFSWELIQPLFKEKSIVEPPEILTKRKALLNYNQMLLLRNVSKEPFGVILFKATKEWLDFSNTEYITEFEEIVSNLFSIIYQSIELRVNETQYRKLYNMTDLFHSTMDIDLILENVLLTIEENFPDFHVELILSNDQDRQTKVQMKPFDYLSERPSTIEAFVSGDLTIDIAKDLNAKILNAPIKGRQAIYGILQVISPINTIYTNKQKNFIRNLAQASGNALENAKLYYQSHRLITDLQLINETSHRLNFNLSVEEMLSFLKKQLIKSFQPMEVGFVFKEDDFHLSEKITDTFCSELSSVYLDYVEKHFEKAQDPLFIADFSRLLGREVQYKSIMAIPMLIEEKISGYCIVLHMEPYFFSFDSFKLMQSLIHHSTLAISNSILRNRLQEMVDRDHLTKLYARRYLDRYVEKSLQMDSSGMFLLIDIDNFKKVNDTYGHQMGDEVLVQISGQLQKMIGTRGICARWGGEELAVYIANLLEDEAINLADQIVKSIPIVTKPQVTISAGLVPWKQGSQPKFQSIFLQADTALYKAKKEGKNQFQVFDNEMQIQQG